MLRLTSYYFALLAQLVEQIPLKDMVGGSNPSQRTGNINS